MHALPFAVGLNPPCATVLPIMAGGSVAGIAFVIFVTTGTIAPQRNLGDAVP